ncbi:MAG: PilZ domain-containing protein [Magnetococcales bacterium]|nr:PilZ domain-containing protein [Magnetococcales bacterium]
MNADRRSRVRVTLAVKAAFFSPGGFLFNVSVVDISSGGIRLEIPVVDPVLFYKESTLKLYFQTGSGPSSSPYVLQIPCRMVWIDGSDVGIEFLNPDPNISHAVGGLIDCAHHIHCG